MYNLDFSVHSKWACRIPIGRVRLGELSTERIRSYWTHVDCWVFCVHPFVDIIIHTFICIICITGGVYAMQTERGAFILKSTRAENLFFHSILREFSLSLHPLSLCSYSFSIKILFSPEYINAVHAVKWNAFSGKILENKRIPIGHGSLYVACDED